MTPDYGTLPSEWAVSRLDKVASVNARIGWKALTASEYQLDGYTFLATPNIKSEAIDFENVNYISQFRYDESPELKLAIGDVLLAKDGNTLGVCNIVRTLPRPATVNGSIAVLRPRHIEPRFLRYVLASTPIQTHIETIKDGMGVPHLFQRDIKRIPVPIPSMDLQRGIADFLDAATARIDRAVELRAKTKALIADKRQAIREEVINQCLRTHGPLPLRRLSKGISQGASPQCDNVPGEGDEWAVLKLSAIKRGTFNPAENKRLPPSIPPNPRHAIHSGDLLITRANTPELVGDAAVVPEGTWRLLLPDLVYRVDLLDNVDSTFILHCILTTRTRQLIQEIARGSSQSMVKLRGEDILALPIPALPLHEQRVTAERINRMLRPLANIPDLIDRQIRLLVERRQALITAAVTGKIDVRTARGADLSSPL